MLMLFLILSRTLDARIIRQECRLIPLAKYQPRTRVYCKLLYFQAMDEVHLFMRRVILIL
jgi:hypothetical protein